MKNRQRKKLIKKSILLIDIASIPYGVSIEQVVKTAKEKGVLLYDSKKGKEPSVYPQKNIKAFKLEDSNENKS